MAKKKAKKQKKKSAKSKKSAKKEKKKSKSRAKAPTTTSQPACPDELLAKLQAAFSDTREEWLAWVGSDIYQLSDRAVNFLLNDAARQRFIDKARTNLAALRDYQDSLAMALLEALIIKIPHIIDQIEEDEMADASMRQSAATP
jgi:hypothetical protein